MYCNIAQSMNRPTRKNKYMCVHRLAAVLAMVTATRIHFVLQRLQLPFNPESIGYRVLELELELELEPLYCPP